MATFNYVYKPGSFDKLHNEFTAFLLKNNTFYEFRQELFDNLGISISQLIYDVSDRKVLSAKSMIISSINFSKTKKGSEFWNNIHKSWVTLCESSDVPEDEKPKQQSFDSIW